MRRWINVIDIDLTFEQLYMIRTHYSKTAKLDYGRF